MNLSAKNALVSGFMKRAYNGSYSSGFGSIGQGGYGTQYQDSPANERSGVPTKALAAAGIVGVGAGGQQIRHQRKIKQHMAQARQAGTAAQKKPGWLDTYIGGGALQEHQNKAILSKQKAQQHLSEAKRLRSEGALGWKSKARDLKSRIVRGFQKARGQQVPKLLPPPAKAVAKGFKPASYFAKIL